MAAESNILYMHVCACTDDKRLVSARAQRNICIILCSVFFSLVFSCGFVHSYAVRSACFHHYWCRLMDCVELILNFYYTFLQPFEFHAFLLIYIYFFLSFFALSLLLNAHTRTHRNTYHNLCSAGFYTSQCSVTFLNCVYGSRFACVLFLPEKRRNYWLFQRNETKYNCTTEGRRAERRECTHTHTKDTQKRININKFIRCEWCGDRIDWRSNVFVLLPVVWIH